MSVAENEQEGKTFPLFHLLECDGEIQKRSSRWGTVRVFLSPPLETQPFKCNNSCHSQRRIQVAFFKFAIHMFESFFCWITLIKSQALESDPVLFISQVERHIACFKGKAIAINITLVNLVREKHRANASLNLLLASILLPYHSTSRTVLLRIVKMQEQSGAFSPNPIQDIQRKGLRTAIMRVLFSS